MHVFNDLGLPHLLLVCLLLPPYIILARMCLTVFLLWLMIKITDLLAQCSLRVVPEVNMVLGLVIVPVLYSKN